MNPLSNPLLEIDNGLPRFDAVKPEHVVPAIDALLAEADKALELAVSDAVPADYDALSEVLSVATERLGSAWGVVGHLMAVANTPELRIAFNEALPKVTEFYTRQGGDERLYAKYKAIAASPAAATLSAPRRKALANWLRNFVLSGADLQGAQKERYNAIQQRLAELTQAFSEHVLDATDGFSYLATEEEMTGVPADVLAAAKVVDEDSRETRYKLSLQFPSYLPVMQYGRDRALREKLYTAYATRASELGPAALDNTPVMQEILALRQEEAALLGYTSYAEASLVPKMADTPAEVMGFLRDLATRARPHAQRDLDELRAFARTELALDDPKSWDIPFVSERLKEARYAFSDQEVKQYFTEPKVLEGLFGIIETLFDVSIRQDSAPTWHPSVRFFRIERKRRADDGSFADGAPQLVGQFYLDAYARAGKRPGAWMDGMRSRWARPEGGLQTPVAHLVCNYAAPAEGRPALLTHDNVTTLFHEFGHGLHHLLTQIDDIGVSGISGVEWDAVELPSQFMENFCWEWDVLQRMTSHVDSAEPLPRALFDKMTAAKNFQSGMQTLRQVEFALFDMRLHAEPGSGARLRQVQNEVRAEVSILPPPPFARPQNTFSHIFAGGYAAGYYSYKWAEVLSADAWSAFEEAGILDAPTGRRYLESILEVGGSRPAMESFKAFRGREPSIEALLRHQGMS